MKLQKDNQKGFTIIEVLIVLAIAGLILLVVFLAVPALQRNSRNTAIKNDANNLAGGISEFRSNNNGKTPSNIDGTGDITVENGSDTQVTKIQGSTQVTTVTSKPDDATINPGELQVMIGVKCDDSTSSRTVSIYYVTETSGTGSIQCLEA